MQASRLPPPPPVQDEMIDMQEREEQAVLDEKLASEKATHGALMREANLDGVESLLDDMVREDPEWGRFVQVRGGQQGVGGPGVGSLCPGERGAAGWGRTPSPLHGHRSWIYANI